MKLITSRENTQYKFLRQLAAEKSATHFLLEGPHLCQEWLRHQGVPELAVFDAVLLEHNDELRALAESLDPQFCLLLASGLMKQLADVQGNQGVYFVVQALEPVLPDRIDHNCLWLDRIQDPGNVGTILRTAAAAGLTHAYLSQGCARAWSRKVLRSAQGAHFALTIFEGLDLQDLSGRLAVPLIATSLVQAYSLYEQELPAEGAWLFGHEGGGVDVALLDRADVRVFIPQAEAVESLNVAAAVAVCLFEQRRQRLAG